MKSKTPSIKDKIPSMKSKTPSYLSIITNIAIIMLIFIGAEIGSTRIAIKLMNSFSSNFSNLYEKYRSAGNIYSKYYIEVINSITVPMKLVEISIIITIFAIMIKIGLRDKQIVSINGLKKTVSIELMILSLSIGVISNIIVNIIPDNMINKSSAYKNLQRSYTKMSSIQLFIAIAILAPLVEEIVLRGMVLFEISRLNSLVAIIASAFIFAVLHGNIVQGIYAFAIGLFIATVDIKYNTILYGILMHSCMNIGSFVSSVISNKFLLITTTAILTTISVIIISINIRNRAVEWTSKYYL